jgi:hypothetical protein
VVSQPARPVASEAEFWAGVANAQRFFLGNADVQLALRRLTEILDRVGIPCAIAGGMALNHHGYRRVTDNVDVLMTRNGLDRLKQAVLGHGYSQAAPGSNGLRDTEHDVLIHVLLAGNYPGDHRHRAWTPAWPESVRGVVRRVRARTGHAGRAKYGPSPLSCSCVNTIVHARLAGNT